MPPSLSVNVGVPPATVTAELRLSVSVTVFPAFRSPVEGDSTTEFKVGPADGPIWSPESCKRVGQDGRVPATVLDCCTVW